MPYRSRKVKGTNRALRRLIGCWADDGRPRGLSKRSPPVMCKTALTEMLLARAPDFAYYVKMQRTLAHNLSRKLLAITSGTHTHDQLSAVVRVSQALSISCLRTRHIPSVLKETHGLSIPDMAMDCVAELFEQDRQGSLVQLCAYFNGIPLESCSDEEALVHLRRLVFSKTYNGLFRFYNEADPTLGKVLRNIKLAVHSLKNFEEHDVCGEPSIAPSACDPLHHLPPADRETLERSLTLAINGRHAIPTMLARLSSYLRGQRLHSRRVSLIDVAVVFRALYTRPLELPALTESGSDRTLQMDVETILGQVHRQAQTAAEKAYVASGKLSSELVDVYLRVIDAGLRATFVDCDGADFSLFAALRKEIPGLTKAAYMKKHRARLEYLSRETHKRARHLLQTA